MIERVLVGIPTLSGKVTIKLAAFLVNLARDRKRSFQVFWSFGYAPVEFARNTLVAEFLASEADRFWMIDDDMKPEPSLVGLLDIDADIVAPKMRVLFPSVAPRHPEIHVCAIAEVEEKPYFMNLENKHGVIPVDATGSGCMIIRRRVLEDERMRVATMSKKDCPPVFRTVTKANGERQVGEDVDFCLRARKLGYTIAVDLDRVVGHAKSVDLEDVAALAAGR